MSKLKGSAEEMDTAKERLCLSLRKTSKTQFKRRNEGRVIERVQGSKTAALEAVFWRQSVPQPRVSGRVILKATSGALKLSRRVRLARPPSLFVYYSCQEVVLEACSPFLYSLSCPSHLSIYPLLFVLPHSSFSLSYLLFPPLNFLSLSRSVCSPFLFISSPRSIFHFHNIPFIIFFIFLLCFPPDPDYFVFSLSPLLCSSSFVSSSLLSLLILCSHGRQTHNYRHFPSASP